MTENQYVWVLLHRRTRKIITPIRRLQNLFIDSNQWYDLQLNCHSGTRNIDKNYILHCNRWHQWWPFADTHFSHVAHRIMPILLLLPMTKVLPLKSKTILPHLCTYAYVYIKIRVCIFQTMCTINRIQVPKMNKMNCFFP